MTQDQECGDNCNCGSGSCSCESMDFYDVMESKLMGMAFFAHKSALFERIKQRIEKQDGEKLDKIADLVVEATRNKFKTEQEAEKKHAELREKLKEVFDE